MHAAGAPINLVLSSNPRLTSLIRIDETRIMAAPSEMTTVNMSGTFVMVGLNTKFIYKVYIEFQYRIRN